MNRETRVALPKTKKALGELFAQQASNEATIRALNSQLQDLKGKQVKTKVVVDPDSQFANIEAIVKAQQEAEAEQARRQAAGDTSAGGQIPEGSRIEDFMFEWQL